MQNAISSYTLWMQNTVPGCTLWMQNTISDCTLRMRFALSASKNQSASIQPHLGKNQSKIGGIIRQIGGQSVRTFSKVQGKISGCIGKIGGQSMRGIRKISGQSVRTSASGKGKTKNAKSRHYKKLRAVICEQTVGSKQKRIKKNALMGVFFYALFCVSHETLPLHSLIH